jgi:hypothetical protein
MLFFPFFIINQNHQKQVPPHHLTLSTLGASIPITPHHQIKKEAHVQPKNSTKYHKPLSQFYPFLDQQFSPTLTLIFSYK